MQIVSIALTKENFWLSGADLGHEGRFSWYSTGDLFEYRNFRTTQPDNHNKKEHCIEFSYYGAWNDVPCDSNYYYICELLK